MCNDAAEGSAGTNTADGFTCRVSQQTHQAVRPAASEDTRRGGRARPLIGRRQNSQCAASGTH